jgi:hypothetical protein
MDEMLQIWCILYHTFSMPDRKSPPEADLERYVSTMFHFETDLLRCPLLAFGAEIAEIESAYKTPFSEIHMPPTSLIFFFILQAAKTSWEDLGAALEIALVQEWCQPHPCGSPRG